MNHFDFKIYPEQPIGPFWFKKRAFKNWFRLVKEENLTQVRRILKKGINVNLRDMHGKAALDYALEKHDLMMIILLIKNGAAIDLSTKEKSFEFALKVSELDFKKKEVLIRYLTEKDRKLGSFLRNHAH